ncbi:MAG TPA: ATP-binding protein [Chthoniobacteraceae bacterium]|nr:ATP-binding protein [Chthoniobacteraceae bacterium]
MSYLSKIKKGAVDLPPRVVLSGPEGIGKSTFGANAPDPLFIAAEDGLTGLEHINRFTPTDYKELLGFLDDMEADANVPFKTLVLDTVDWLERLIQGHCCKRDKKANIEAYGYGKGYKIVEPELVALLAQLDRIRHKHKVAIIILSHVHIKNHTPPGGEPFDRYEMKGHKGFTGILREWPDACLFAVYETFKTEDDDGHKKVIGGDRIMHTSWAPGWDAKNRYNLPEILPLDKDRGFFAFLEAVDEHRNQPVVKPTKEELCDQIKNLLPLATFASEEDKAKAIAWAETLDSQPVEKLESGLKWLQAQVDKEEES